MYWWVRCIVLKVLLRFVFAALVCDKKLINLNNTNVATLTASSLQSRVGRVWLGTDEMWIASLEDNMPTLLVKISSQGPATITKVSFAVTFSTEVQVLYEDEENVVVDMKVCIHVPLPFFPNEGFL